MYVSFFDVKNHHGSSDSTGCIVQISDILNVTCSSSRHCNNKILHADFRSNFAGPLHWSFEHLERFRNLKFAVKRITNIQSTVLSSSRGGRSCLVYSSSPIGLNLANF